MQFDSFKNAELYNESQIGLLCSPVELAMLVDALEFFVTKGGITDLKSGLLFFPLSNDLCNIIERVKAMREAWRKEARL